MPGRGSLRVVESHFDDRHGWSGLGRVAGGGGGEMGERSKGRRTFPSILCSLISGQKTPQAGSRIEFHDYWKGC